MAVADIAPFAARLALLGALLATAPGCLVLNLNPVYDDDSLGWDPALVGTWRDAEDNVTVKIDADEWKSYRVHYVHPIETGDLTAYLTIVGNERYLDLMPVRGKDHGSFLIPVHAVVHLRLGGDTLRVSPLSYDWFLDRSRSGAGAGSLVYSFDQKENALVVSPTAAFRNWLRQQQVDGAAFGAPAVFTRVKE